MSNTPVAGTFRIDGMLQGTLPGDDLIASQLEDWATVARKQGLRFHLQIEGGSFSIVGDPATCKTSMLGNRMLSTLIEDALNSLLELLTTPARSAAFSTIRSEEFRPGVVVQTLYTVDTDGAITSEQRTLDIDTELPPPEITTASIRRFAIIGLLAIALGFFISSFFIDYRKLFSQARDQVAPLAKEEVTIHQEALGDIISVKLAGVDNRRSAMLFEISRGPGWERAIHSSPSDSSGSWPEFLTRQAVHQGRLRVELYNKKGELLSKGDIGIDGLLVKGKINVAFSVNLADRLSTVVVRP